MLSEEKHVSGAVLSEGPPDPISSVEVQVEKVDNQGAPISSRTLITTLNGKTYTL
ncbi:MAG: hypothetical protein ACP5KV_07760 [Candidatus Methanomethylicaceae archaeon]